MKKLILATLMAGLIPMLSLAQGTVNFGSGVPGVQIVVQSDGVTPVPTGFSAALYWAPLGSLEGQLSQLGATTTVFGGSGFIVGGTRTTGALTAPGTDALFQVRAWNGAYTSYEAALAGVPGTQAGKTAMFQNPTANPAASPPPAPAPLSGWTAPLVVTPIPEPSTIALAGLGLASLLIIRRRK